MDDLNKLKIDRDRPGMQPVARRVLLRYLVPVGIPVIAGIHFITGHVPAILHPAFKVETDNVVTVCPAPR